MYSAFSQQIWKPRTSVKLRFAIAQGVIVAAIIGLMAIALYFPVQKRLVSITDNSYQILANNLSSSIFSDYQTAHAANASSNDITAARQRVVNTLRRADGQQGVKYILIIDHDQKVYYDSISGADSLENRLYRDTLTAAVGKSNGDLVYGKVQRQGLPYYNYAAPFVSNNQILYSVRLGIDPEIIDGEFIKLASLFLQLAIFGIVLGIAAAYFLASRLTRPIIMLTESALAIRAGNLSAYPDISTNDELEQLSREFQSMVEKLKAFYFQEYAQKKEAQGAKKRLEEVNARLQELDRQKSDFMNAASHQLRTPLSIIHWSLSIIVDEAAHLNLEPAQKEMLEESLKSTKRMVDLVNDLLDISRIEQGRKELNWEKGNFGSVCEQLVSALKPLAQQKELELTYEQQGTIPDSFLDEKGFYQVVNNFVDNAIKYTAKGYVHVTCAAVDDTIQIKISDTGIGMTEQERHDLFTRFSRGDEASKMFANGSGLGMYVARAILVQHGGTIDVESQKDKGTTFTLTMPIYLQMPTAAQQLISPTHE